MRKLKNLVVGSLLVATLSTVLYGCGSKDESAQQTQTNATKEVTTASSELSLAGMPELAAGAEMTLNGVTYRNDGNGTYIVGSESTTQATAQTTTQATTAASGVSDNADLKQAFLNTPCIESMDDLNLSVNDCIARYGSDYTTGTNALNWSNSNGWKVTVDTSSDGTKVEGISASPVDWSVWDDSSSNLSSVDSLVKGTSTYADAVAAIGSSGTIQAIYYYSSGNTYTITWHQSTTFSRTITFDAKTNVIRVIV